MEEPRRHSLLRRQLKRFFETVEDLPPDVRSFIDAVNDAYRQADLDRTMLERSFELTSQELNQANTNLRLAVSELHEAQRGLEQRVYERTHALAEANTNLGLKIAEQQHAEEALRKSETTVRQIQKMESIGRLAGGIAHDFNNMLTVIFANTDVMLATGVDAETRGQVEDIRKAAESAASLTGQLLAFSRKQLLSPKVFDLNELVDNIRRMLSRLIGEDIDLAIQLNPEAGSIRADPGQIHQVLFNLVANARDAMPEGGKLTISTDRRVVDLETPAPHAGVRPGDYVALSVADSGIGMKPEVRAQIFEPFFTTKEMGRGTGLGLATVYGIVKQSEGYIDVISEEGVGTEFRLLFPRVSPLGETQAQDDAGPTAVSAGVILIVEDQESVRTVARNVLQRRGYTVVEAADGQDALDKSAQLPRIDLLLTDVVMPRLNGKALAARLTAARPGLKVLYMTGYIDDAELIGAVRESQVPVLQKPFSATGLLQRVRETLETSG